jgi:hypothetical protein
MKVTCKIEFEVNLIEAEVSNCGIRVCEETP